MFYSHIIILTKLTVFLKATTHRSGSYLEGVLRRPAGIIVQLEEVPTLRSIDVTTGCWLPKFGISYKNAARLVLQVINISE